MSEIRLKRQSEPATPPAGYVVIWPDPQTGGLKAKDETGTTTSYDIIAEADARERADFNLSSAVTSESQSRQAGDGALQTQIDTETSLRTQSDSALQAAIYDIMTRYDADKIILDAADASEVSARETAISAVLSAITTEAESRATAITTEQEARTVADTILQSSITALETSLTVEATNRTAQDANLQSNIDAIPAAITGAVASEANLRATADSAIATSISEEIAARQSADTTESAARVSTDADLQAQITAESSARTTADADILASLSDAIAVRTVAIANEVSARESADAALQANIDVEATTRASTDTTLQTTIDTLTTRHDTDISTLQTDLASEVTRAQAAETTLNIAIGTKQNSLGFTPVNKSGDTLAGNLNMNSNKITGLPMPENATDAVPKIYADNISGGALPQAPVADPCLIDDIQTSPPVGAKYSEVYIIAGIPTGAWSSFGAGWAVQLLVVNGADTWVPLWSRPVQSGDRFAVASKDGHSGTRVTGSFVGKIDQICTVTGGIPGAYTYQFTAPQDRWSFFVAASASDHFGQTYQFSSSQNAWFMTGGPASTQLGDGLAYLASILNVQYDNTTVGLTSTNQLKVIGATGTELGYLSGVTSAIQTQLNAKEPTVTKGTIAGAGGISIAGGADAAIGSGVTVGVDGSHYLPTTVDKTNWDSKQGSGDYITALTGDVTASGPGSAVAIVASVGGVTTANIASGATAANNATSVNTTSAIVRRDASGNFTAGTITATLSGNATSATTATNFSGSLSGDVTGNQGTTSISALARSKLANGTAYRILANNAAGAISENAAITASRAVASDANGQLTASATTSTELGYLSGVTSAIQPQLDGKQASGTYITALTGDVTATGGGSAATTISALARTKLANGTAYRILANNATGAISENAAITASRAVASDANGQLTASATTTTELGYLSGVTSAIQTQLGTKQASLGFTPLNKAGDTLGGALNASGYEIQSPRLRAYSETTTVASITGSVTIDYSAGNIKDYTLTGNVTGVTITNAPVTGTTGVLTLFLTGAFSFAWPTSVVWPGGTAPTLTASSAHTDIITLITKNGGTTWYGSVTGLNF